MSLQSIRTYAFVARFRVLFIYLLLMLTLVCVSAHVQGQPINRNNLLVSVGSATAGGGAPNPETIFEYSLSGTRIRSIPVPLGPGGDEYVRDIVLDSNGNIDAF